MYEIIVVTHSEQKYAVRGYVENEKLIETVLSCMVTKE